MGTNGDQSPKPIERRRLLVGIVGGLLCYVLCLFVPAGTLAWIRGWLFLFVMIGTMISLVQYLRRVNPEVITARTTAHKGTKRWDLFLLGILFPTMMAILILAALDDGRFHWFRVPWWLCGIGYVLLILGFAGVTWALSVNKFFERTVRIQTDRGHTVVDTGPYAIVRHPGYVATCLVCAGMSLSLGSVWALIPASLSCGVLMVRTVWEDRTLQEELTGYKEYAQRVRYKLVPGVW